MAVEAPVRTPQRTTDDRDQDDRPWQVIVLNDNHNTFEGVAFALSHTLPGVTYERGLADRRPHPPQRPRRRLERRARS